MTDIILWELKRRRIAIIGWSLGSVVLTTVILMLYPSIRDQAQELNQVINQLPGGLRGLKTGGASNIDVADPIAFLNSQLFYATLPILWIILAITRGNSVLGHEEQNRTLELLLARPMSRSRLLTAKALSFLLEGSIVGAVTLAVIVLAAPLFQLHVGTLHLLIATAYTMAFSLSFGLVAFALQATSLVTRKISAIVAVVLGFGGYIIASLSGLTDWLQAPAKLTPFHYFKPDAILRGQAVHGLDIYLAGIFISCAVVAYIGFRGRDIR